MKRMFSAIMILLVGVGAGLMVGLFLPAELRLKVSRQLADSIERMVEQMPDG